MRLWVRANHAAVRECVVQQEHVVVIVGPLSVGVIVGDCRGRVCWRARCARCARWRPAGGQHAPGCVNNSRQLRAHAAECVPQGEGQIAFLGLPIWANAGSREHWVCLVGLPFCPALRACMRASDTLQQASRASAGAVWLRPWCLGLCRVLPCRVPPSPAIKGPASAGAVMFFLFFFLRSGLLALAGSQPNRFSPASHHTASSR